MGQLDKLIFQYEELDNNIQQSIKYRAVLKLQIACLLCPFVLGDKIINYIGIKGIVCRIESGLNVGTYRLFINYYKRDGELGAVEIKALANQQWEKVDE